MYIIFYGQDICGDFWRSWVSELYHFLWGRESQWAGLHLICRQAHCDFTFSSLCYLTYMYDIFLTYRVQHINIACFSYLVKTLSMIFHICHLISFQCGDVVTMMKTCSYMWRSIEYIYIIQEWWYNISNNVFSWSKIC